MLTPPCEGESNPHRIDKCYKPEDDTPPGKLAYQSPQAVYLELTLACNSRCLGCVNGGFIANPNTRELRSIFHRPLNGEDWALILDKLGPSVTFINLTGGEPTLHPDFQSVAISIDRREIDFVVFTNARWREPERLVSFLAQLPHFKGFLISLHGASPETHEAFSGVTGSFEEAVANTTLAVRAGLTVSTSTVITHQNVPELDLITALSRELGARGAVFNRFLIPVTCREQPVRGGCLTDIAPTQSESRAAVRVIESLHEKTGESHQISYGPCIPQCFVPSSSVGCSAGETFFVVDPWGNVKPCTDAVLNCGSLLTQTMEEIWWSKEMQYWRGLIPPGCSGCAALSICRAGCRAMALASGLERDPLMRDPIPHTENVRQDVSASAFIYPIDRAQSHIQRLHHQT